MTYIGALALGVGLAILTIMAIGAVTTILCPCVNSCVGCWLTGPWYCSSPVIPFVVFIIIVYVLILIARGDYWNDVKLDGPKKVNENVNDIMDTIIVAPLLYVLLKFKKVLS